MYFTDSLLIFLLCRFNYLLVMQILVINQYVFIRAAKQ